MSMIEGKPSRSSTSGPTRGASAPGSRSPCGIPSSRRRTRSLKQPVDSYNRGQGTLIQKIIREEVMAAFSNEIRDAVKLARKQVAGEVGQQVATAVENAMRGR